MKLNSRLFLSPFDYSTTANDPCTSAIETVVVTGVTTENCCHATARDAMFNGYRVAFISDATGTYDYPDVGFGSIPAQEVHRVTMGVLAVSTAHVMTVDELITKTTFSRGTSSADE